MRLVFSLVLLSLYTTSAVAKESRNPNPLTPEQIRDGWILLFDGETLYGWEQVNDVNWHVQDGEIRASQGEVGWLMTTSEFADYTLHVEFRAGEDSNSGVFLRSLTKPRREKEDEDCYEVNIALPTNPFPTGSVVKRQLADATIVEALNPWDGQWHAYDLTIQGNKLTVKLDGKMLLEYTDPNPRVRGHIGLQHNRGEIAFRNVRLKPLSMKPIFNGKDLAGWNIDRAEASEFKVTPEGELQVLNGRGQLESDTSHGDFVLQLECFVNGDALNSGVFFRCIPGEFTNGYECQIQNGMKDGDPSKPQDCGTGGFYRRQDARRIITQDREWFAMTLVADGPHMAAWVNGTQVSDWTDTREPDENPRKGLRTKPGTLAIQGHDPTTDLRFRNLQIVEMPSEE